MSTSNSTVTDGLIICSNIVNLGGIRSLPAAIDSQILFCPGRVDDLSFFEYLNHFVFCQLNFIVLFPFLIKYYHILFVIILFCLGSDRLSGLLSFLPALRFSILTPLFCPSSSVPLSYFSLAVPILECLEKHSCMSSPFPIAILNGTSFLSLVQENINMPSGHYYRLCS